MTENHPCAEVNTTPQELVDIPRRDGATYDHELDGPRLHKQHNRVFAFMKDGAWRSLAAIAAGTGDPEASVSARLRDLRKERFGAHGVDRRRVTGGLYEYRLVINRPDLFSPPAGFTNEGVGLLSIPAPRGKGGQTAPISASADAYAKGTT